ncbi:transposase, partial [bacterium]|nr:transposase [bacterium]
MERELSPLPDKEKKLVSILELIRVEEYVPRRWWSRGRPWKERSLFARAFVAKMVYNLSTTEGLIERINKDDNLRGICGWEKGEKLPSESMFSRAFRAFAHNKLPQRVHEALLEKYESERLVGHISRDSTDIVAREKAVSKPKDEEEPKPKRKRGRPKKGEEKLTKEPSRL